MDTQLHSWKQQGVTRLWRYTEFKSKFGGWHLTADDAGIESLVALLTLLQVSPGSHRTVAVTAPSSAVLRVPNYQQGRALWQAPAKWQIRFSPSPDTWNFPASAEPAELVFGANYLPELVAGLRGIPRGEGDFSIGRSENGSLALWLWWHPSAA